MYTILWLAIAQSIWINIKVCDKAVMYIDHSCFSRQTFAFIYVRNPPVDRFLTVMQLEGHQLL